MILTVGANESKAAQSRSICQCCSQFMAGKIELLYGKAKQTKPNHDPSDVPRPHSTNDGNNNLAASANPTSSTIKTALEYATL
eukprot:2889922-Rhodomonas_salina.1